MCSHGGRCTREVHPGDINNKRKKNVLECNSSIVFFCDFSLIVLHSIVAITVTINFTVVMSVFVVIAGILLFLIIIIINYDC